MTFDKEQTARKTAKILLDTKSVLFNVQTPFQYTSGRVGPVYIDCRRLISFPAARSTLMEFASALINEHLTDKEIDTIVGGETAGIPYAAFLSERLNKPMAYIRKKPKGVGRLAQIEGHVEENKNVLLVEDLQNYGSSQKTFIEALRAANLNIKHAFVLFSYGNENAKQIMKDLNVSLLSLAGWLDVIRAARENGYFDDDTLNSVQSYLDDPIAWSNKYKKTHDDIEQTGTY
jgi:orotate phosphoribosyltransferase